MRPRLPRQKVEHIHLAHKVTRVSCPLAEAEWFSSSALYQMEQLSQHNLSMFCCQCVKLVPKARQVKLSEEFVLTQWWKTPLWSGLSHCWLEQILECTQKKMHDIFSELNLRLQLRLRTKFDAVRCWNRKYSFVNGSSDHSWEGLVSPHATWNVGLRTERMKKSMCCARQK